MGKFSENMNDEDMKKELVKFAEIAIPLVFACLICLLLGSCRSQFVDISDDMFIHDTIRIETEHLKTDSLIQHDSIWHFECLKADSVIIKDVIYKYVYKPKVEYRDSIVYRDREKIVVSEKVVKEKPSLWQKMLSTMGIVALVMLVFSVGFNLWRLFKGK